MTKDEISQRISAIERELAELKAAASEPVHDEWLKIGNEYWCTLDHDAHPRGVFHATHTGNLADFSRIATGNCFRTEAEARRHREALKVQAELRRMPGRLFPVPMKNEWKYCIHFSAENMRFCSDNWKSPGFAIAGVWFESQESADNALDTIGQDRLRVWLDDYLQTPMEGGAE